MYHDDTDDASLRKKASEAIDTGALPSRKQDRTMGGPGSGAFCALCHKALMWHMTEVELHFDDVVDDIPRTGSLKLHHRCFAAWVIEREKGEDLSF
jgi:hypothetical protein